MTFSRRTLIKAPGLAAATVAAPLKLAYGQTAEFTFKYANNQPPVHPMNVRAKEAVEAIRKETNGRLDIQLFPSNQLGSDTDTLSQLRSGGVEMFNLSGLILATLVPPAALNGLGFAFPNYDTVWRAMDGDVGKYVREQIGKAGLVAMDKIWDNGFRQITTSTKPINTAEDLRGFKIRVPVSPMWTSMFKAFDSAPASINASEMYTALQTKVVDGQENPFAVISNFKLYEVQKFCSITNHMWDGFWFLGNRRAWERLPEDLRAIVAKALGANMTRDVVNLFHHLTGYSRAPRFEKLLVAPLNMRTRFVDLIGREAANARAGRPARIVAKVNQGGDQGGFGGMMSLRVKASAQGGEAAAIATAASVELWKRATSLGGTESLIEHRASVEGAGTPAPPDLLRLSVGIEDCADLIADLEQALARAHA
jgi:tripartite ATP-independent transporter DctP family solute receptor